MTPSLAERLALFFPAEAAVVPARKMGRQVVNLAFSQALQFSCGQSIHLKRTLPSPELRQAQPPWEAVYAGDPNLEPLAVERAWADPRRYSLIGVTHTLSTPVPLRLLPALPLAALHSWDALVCTSRAARTAVEQMFEQTEALWRCRGGEPPRRLQLPVIPLGVDAAAFEPPCRRRDARARLKLPANAMVVLWTGRLELHCKAHHGATFRALAHAAAACPERPWVLLMYGTAVMPEMPKALRQASAQLCPAVQVQLLDGHDLELGSLARAASDAFVSLVDCLQETFGLTPVEAMAAGLPVVVSDWNGYRDTVQHARTGFLIDTCSYGPGWAAGSLQQLARQEQALDRVSAQISSQIRVDERQAGTALARLAASPATAVAMGQLGRLRVSATYDWPVVLSQYAELLNELADRRARAQADPALAPLADLRPIPGLQQIFAAWPSQTLTSDTALQQVPGTSAAQLDEALDLLAFRLYSKALPSAALIRAAYGQVCRQGPISLADLLERPDLAWARSAKAARLAEALGWLLKQGFIAPGDP